MKTTTYHADFEIRFLRPVEGRALVLVDEIIGWIVGSLAGLRVAQLLRRHDASETRSLRWKTSSRLKNPKSWTHYDDTACRRFIIH
jgi:hypothetical protein